MRDRLLKARGWKAPALLSLLVLLAAACGEEAAVVEPTDEERSVESIAMILPGRADDEGYSQVGATGLEAASERFGVETAVAESVEVAQQVEVFRDFANQGFNLIVGWGGQWEDGALEVAPEFPETFFVVVNGVGGNDSNMASADFAGEQWTFLEGYVAGQVTESGTVGIIVGPCFDATARQAHGYRDGVRFANPDAEVIITGLDSFEDPAGGKEAALAQIAEGADVIHTNLNTGNLGVIEAAQEQGDILVTNEYADAYDTAPDVLLTSSVRDIGTLVTHAVELIEDGRFDGSPIRVELSEEDEALAPFRQHAPESLYDEAKEVQNRIANGEIEVTPDPQCPYSS